MLYGGLEKDYDRLVKICPHVPSREPAKTGVIVEWEEKGENSVQFQDKQYFFKVKPTISLCTVAMERAIFIECESRKPHKT